MASHSEDAFSRLLSHLSLVIHLREAPPSGCVRYRERDLLACSASLSAVSESLPPGVNLRSIEDPTTPLDDLPGYVRHLESCIPGGCRSFGPNDLQNFGPGPIDGGGFANVWLCEKSDGTKVVIKSYRCYASSSRLPAFLRLYKEALVCSRLNGINGANFVPLLGIHSSRNHPFALVLGFMGHGNLRCYSLNNQNIRRMELLLQVARGLEIMHNRDLIHANIRIENILVGSDGRARIGDLTTASVSSTSSHRTAPGGFTSAGASKEDDIRALGILVWEVFAGEAPFSGERVVVGIDPMSDGRRPKRPPHPDLSDNVWKMIRDCWEVDPSRRKTIRDVISVLEAEVNRRK